MTPRADPLKPQWLHILAALADQHLHGYGIVRSVLEQTGGNLRLWPVTLYGALDELADNGLIRELTGADRPKGESEKRRYYAITPRGRTALRQEGKRLAALSELALRRSGRS